MLSKRGLTRNWVFILYPESAPENWRDIIDETHIEWVESPLHDKDLENPDEIEIEKKSHYHVLLLFPSQKSYEQVKEITDSLNSTIPQPCNTVKGTIRYMIHKDTPHKYQYSFYNIIPHGGADLNSLCQPTATERLQIQIDIIDFIESNDITEFWDLVMYARMENQEWLNVLLNFSTVSLKASVTSRRHRNDRKIVSKNVIACVDSGTGELIREESLPFG